MNDQPSPLTRLLSQLRGLVSIADTEVNRRDLTCPRHSEVQLELDFYDHKKNDFKWSTRLSAAAFGS